MSEALNIPKDEKQDIPSTPEARIKELMELPLAQKKNFIPQVGMNFGLGPFVFKVTVVNPSQLRFTATLADVIINGVNDSKKVSEIISPVTGKGIVKE